MIYGYCRISTDRQNIERQIRNILKYCPDAIIKQEIYTGTKTDGRKVFEQLLKIIKSGDTIIFDSVSRMIRSLWLYLSYTLNTLKSLYNTQSLCLDLKLHWDYNNNDGNITTP